MASWIEPIILPPIGLPAGKLGSLGERASWEAFASSATPEQLAEAERMLQVIKAQPREPVILPTRMPVIERQVPSADEEAALRAEIGELILRAMPATPLEVAEMIRPMRPEFLREERDWLRAKVAEHQNPWRIQRAPPKASNAASSGGTR
jgi:hypothetical protein